VLDVLRLFASPVGLKANELGDCIACVLSLLPPPFRVVLQATLAFQLEPLFGTLIGWAAGVARMPGWATWVGAVGPHAAIDQLLRHLACDAWLMPP
jgi:hypothetical protein